MSVSFSWNPKPEEQENYFGRGSGLESALTATFGGFPIILRGEHIPKLEIMVNCGYKDVNDIIQALYEFGRIEINAHY